MVKKVPCKFTCKGVFFCYFIGRQPYSEGSLSRAVHGVTFTFALDFLDLTTFLQQILVARCASYNCMTYVYCAPLQSCRRLYQLGD